MGALTDIAGKYAGGGLRTALSRISPESLPGLCEIRVRLGRPLMARFALGEGFITAEGRLSETAAEAFVPTERDISVTMELLTEYSMYAYQDELRKGFITIPGGHRVGVSGQCALEDGSGAVSTFKHVSGLCFRVAGEAKGCGDAVIGLLAPEGAGFLHTMIIAPPGCGKTTLLRDIVRILSHGGMTAGVADERGELAGLNRGRPVFDLGPRTDVIDGCPKAQALEMLLRSMCPEVVAVDEVGTAEDAKALRDAMNAGVKLLCTAHGGSVEEARARPLLGELMDGGVFERFVVLGRGMPPGRVVGVYDKAYNALFL